MSIYDISIKAVDGSEISLSEYRDKVLLIVNTAVKCGLTPQYKDLQELYEKYKDKGLVILDFPCNQFMNQAPGTGEEIHAFCTGRFGITFPQFAKIEVNGKNESTLYKYLKEKKSGFGGSKIKWNFTKFLVNRSGEVVGRFAPTAKPKNLVDKIAALL